MTENDFTWTESIAIVSLLDIVPRPNEHRKCESDRFNVIGLTCIGSNIRSREGSQNIRRDVQRVAVNLLRQLLAAGAPDQRTAQALPTVGLHPHDHDALGHLHDIGAPLSPSARRAHGTRWVSATTAPA